MSKTKTTKNLTKSNNNELFKDKAEKNLSFRIEPQCGTITNLLT
jgi:hypothetical protein